MKNLKNLGKVLSSKEQKSVKGGRMACGKYGGGCPSFAPICCSNVWCAVNGEECRKYDGLQGMVPSFV